MSDKVSFLKVIVYAQKNNLDIKAAAKELGYEFKAKDLQNLGGDPGKPIDNFEGSKKEDTQEMQRLWGGNTWEEASGWEKAGKIILTVLTYPFLALTSCSPEEPIKTPIEPPVDNTKKEPVINVTVVFNTSVEIKSGMSVEDFTTALKEIFDQYGFDDIAKIAATLEQMGLELSEISALLEAMKTQQQNNHEEIKEAHAIIIAMMESMVTEMKNNGAKLDEILTELKNHGVALGDIVTVLKDNGFKLDAIIAELQKQGASLDDIVTILKNQGAKYEELKAVLVKNGETQVDILKSVQLLLNDNQEMANKLDKIIDLLIQNKKIGENCEDLLGKLLDKNFEINNGTTVDTAKLEALLTKILDAIYASTKQNADFDTKTHELLSTIIDKLDSLDKKGQDGVGKIIDAINSNTEVAKGTQGLVKELLKKTDKIGADTGAILEVVGKIAAKEPVDLTAIQDMLAKILKATTKNGDVLNSIDEKLNFVGVALEGIKNQIGEGNEKILGKLQEILNKIPDGCKCKDVDLSVVIEKLDEIIVKIQTQNNGNHEGILGDLDSLDGLL